MRELESTVRRPLLGNLTANVTVRFWPSLAVKPTLRTALCWFTVDPMQPFAGMIQERIATENRGDVVSELNGLI